MSIPMPIFGLYILIILQHLSDISEFEDLMTTSSDEDIPPLDDISY